MRQSASFVLSSTILIHSSFVQAMSSSDIEVGGGSSRIDSDSMVDEGDSSDIEIGGLPVGSSESDGGGIEVGEPAGDRVDWRKGPRNRGPLVQSTSGSFWAVLLQETPTGLRQIFGVAQFEWALSHPDYNRRNNRDCGVLTYTACRDTTYLLVDPVAFPEGFDFERPTATVVALHACGRSEVDTGDGLATVNSLLGAQRAKCGVVLLCSDREATAFKTAGGESWCFRSGTVFARTKAHVGISGHPTKRQLVAWRKQVKAAFAEVPVAEVPVDRPAPLLFLPRALDTESLDAAAAPGRWNIKQEIDPIRLVQALGVVQHLRSPQYFQEVLEDVGEYFGLDESAPVERNPDNDPRRTALLTGMARADVVAMLLTRRRFHQWRLDDAIKSIHIYSDASPVVGVELQGMIIDIVLNDGGFHRVTLPGSTLAYGHTGTWDKGVALLWALWLVAGPEERDLVYVCSKVRSLTTDFGVEMHLLEIPDITKAFIAWLGGQPLHTLRPYINTDSRIFQKALRIAGWSHTLGNIMKEVAEEFPQWPQWLGFLRALTKFFRNKSYRQHIARCLGHVPGVADSMKSFRATFAKWRYETVVNTQFELGKRRELCETHMTRAMFINAQDQTLVTTVMEACADSGFWRWMAVSHDNAFRRLEVLRKWGMVCPCEECNAERRRVNFRKHVPCPRTSDY